MQTASEAIAYVKRTGTAVVVAAESIGDMSASEALAQVGQHSPSTRRILVTEEDSGGATKSHANDDIHAVVPRADESFLETVIRDALERTVLEALHRETSEKLSSTETKLDTLTTRLEEEVADRTSQLQQKIRELEGRNRIARHLMRIHSMEETLEEVLTVLSEVLLVDRAVVHLNDGHSLKPSVEIRIRENDQVPELYDPGEGVESAPIVKRALEQARDSHKPQNVTDPQTPFVSPFAVVPILRETELLGLIEVENYRSGRQITAAELETLVSLAVEVAVAIQDVRYHENFEKWKHQLESILKEVVHVDSPGSD